MKKILISSPSSTSIVFLPYIFGVLKTYCEESDLIAQSYDWLKPIYKRPSLSEIEQIFKNHTIDVLGLSCYVWNFKLQMEIAAIAKKHNPECLVVVGGPEPDWNDPQFFVKNTNVDIVVMQDGEIPFKKILETRLQTCHPADYQCIPGLIVNLNGLAQKTLPPELVRQWSDRSPYASQPIFSELVQELNQPAVILETNRGCPYSCQFCDWGSNTFSKIRTFSINRVMDEVRWISENKIHRVYVADANFGILERDLEIAEEFALQKGKTSWPQIVDICISKNQIQRVTNICTTLAKAQLLKGALVGFQTTNPTALDAMKRKNLSIQEHQNMMAELKNVDATAYATLIVGCPEDTLDDFMNSVGELIDAGYDKAIRYYLYALLPNAPAHKPEYIQKYQIQYVQRKLVEFSIDPEGHKSPHYPRIKYIIQHEKMSQQDWVQECLFIAFVTAFEVLGLTKYISIFFKKNKGMSKKEFYKKLFYSVFETNKTFLNKVTSDLKQHYLNFIAHDDAHFFIQIQPNEYLCEPERLLFLSAVENVDQFYIEMLETLDQWQVVSKEELQDLVNYQKFSIHKIKLQDVQKSVSLKYNWKNFFSESYNEAHPAPGKIIVQTNIYNDNLSWLTAEKVVRWRQYREHIIRSYSYKDGITLIPSKSIHSSEV